MFHQILHRVLRVLRNWSNTIDNSISEQVAPQLETSKAPQAKKTHLRM